MIYEWQCLICDEINEISKPIAQCNEKPDSCEFCEATDGEWKRIYSMPMQLKASYPDGHRRKGFAEVREAQKINREGIESGDRQKRTEIAKEIRKMGVRITDS